MKLLLATGNLSTSIVDTDGGNGCCGRKGVKSSSPAVAFLECSQHEVSASWTQALTTYSPYLVLFKLFLKLDITSFYKTPPLLWFLGVSVKLIQLKMYVYVIYLLRISLKYTIYFGQGNPHTLSPTSFQFPLTSRPLFIAHWVQSVCPYVHDCRAT